ncbi:uncharacterized protein [Nicotiana sylvestris]|uniref:Uncharacterized protein LOC104248863 n=1 Tax=Nicotiana sylvestris TaxID=4096 RepID=A0A1U7YHD3_NICSY|nr:PREDICTED: uncharacterized protein LOC104248863 [Nicotiana sylvestris]
MSATVSGVLFPFLFLVLFISFLGAPVSQAKGSKEMVPLIEPGKAEKMMIMLNNTRRKLGSFQICALCTCCGGAKAVCLPTPCCYAINCNIPNRPFGYCSFTPKTCNCFGCHY